MEFVTLSFIAVHLYELLTTNYDKSVSNKQEGIKEYENGDRVIFFHQLTKIVING